MHRWIVWAVLSAGASSWAQTATAPVEAEVPASGNLVPFTTPYVRSGPPLLRATSSFDRLPGSRTLVGGRLPNQEKFSGRVEAAFRGSGVLPLRAQSPGGLGAPRAMGARLPAQSGELFGRLRTYTNLGTLPARSGKFGRLP